jgi:thermolabile hemolysin
MTRWMAGRAACRLLLAGVSLGSWSASVAVALAPSRLIVFGDSLSDIGNIDDATGGFVPGSSYFNGRFSNGPAWVEWLANDLGAGPLAPSTAGGDNFAYGGAQTSGSSGFEGLVIRDLDEQLAAYRASRLADPDALYVVWAGANDLFDGQTNVAVPVNRVIAALETLTALGARQFLVPNLPILGKIPEYNRDPAASARLDQLSHEYNNVLGQAMESFAARHLNATFYQLDVGELFSNAIAAPQAWGLTNVSDPAAPGLDPGMVFYNENRIVAHPEHYLFWDTIHPTAAVHRILGDVAERLLEGVPGDFNTNGKVDVADLTLWRSGFGTGAVPRRGDADSDQDVDGADFLSWQRSAGTNLTGLPRAEASTTVPEPGSSGPIIMGSIALMRTRRSRYRPHGFPQYGAA